MVDNLVPKLIENSVINKMTIHLKNAYEYKRDYYNLLVNVSIFVVFTIGISIFLYLRYKGKPTKEQQEEIKRKKQMYIFSKLKQYECTRQKINNEMITNLPHY